MSFLDSLGRPRTLDTPGAAAFLGVHKSTLLDLVKSQRVPAAKIGRSWCFIEEDLATYIRDQYQCRSTNNRAATSGTPESLSRVAGGYVSRLEKLMKSRRKGATTS